jgi:hypothetical protein
VGDQHQQLGLFIFKCWSWKTWKKVIFRYFGSLNKGIKLEYNINFNDIRCNFKAFLNIFFSCTLGWIKCIRRGSLLFPFFSEFCPATLAGFSHRRSHIWNRFKGQRPGSEYQPQGLGLICVMGTRQILTWNIWMPTTPTLVPPSHR